MPTIGQIQGMLLEEVLLHLLRFSGYVPVTAVGGDPALNSGPSGMQVRGRGEDHQIDAIADFMIPQPFSNPSRLLVEAKFRNAPAGIEVVRNAVGVLKDVSEFWATGDEPNAHPRYHYQYAIIAPSGFSAPAQRYAVAQDVYLIPFDKAGFFRPVIDSIKNVGKALSQISEGGREELSVPLAKLRDEIRGRLMHGAAFGHVRRAGSELNAALEVVIAAARALEFSIIAMAMGRLPLVLTPAPRVSLEDIPDSLFVRIYWDDEGWYLTRVGGSEERLFSFDLPEVLFKRYAIQDRMTPERAIRLKAEALRRLTALVSRDGRTRAIEFLLDPDWIERILRALDKRE